MKLFKNIVISEELKYHLDNKISLNELNRMKKIPSNMVFFFMTCLLGCGSVLLVITGSQLNPRLQGLQAFTFQPLCLWE